MKYAPIKKIVIYARVSTEEQAENGYSIDAQLDILRNYCIATQAEVVDEYVDRGVSGTSINGRYELQRLLKDAEESKFDEVIVWKFNRMARKNIDLLHLVEKLEKNNIPSVLTLKILKLAHPWDVSHCK